MIVFPAPFSQVNGHLLPFQADELNPAPVDQGLVCAAAEPYRDARSAAPADLLVTAV